MRLILLLSLPTFILGINPYEPGPYETKHTYFYGFLNNGLPKNLDVWAPAKDGTFPMLYFVDGLGSLIPGTAYSKVLERVASHGVVVATPWAPELITDYDPGWVDDLVAWVETHLEDKLHNNGFPADLHIDNNNIFLVGHSSGSHTVVASLEEHCGNVKGQVLLSPVDGHDPYGVVDDFVITPGEPVNYETPTLIVVTGLDEVPAIDIGGDWYPACAPHDLSNRRFYDAMPGPTWMVNATAYGMADFLDPEFLSIVQGTHFCATDINSDKHIYRSFVAGQIVSFMAAVYSGDCFALVFVEDSSFWKIDGVVEKKGDSDAVCGNPYCSRNGK